MIAFLAVFAAAAAANALLLVYVADRLSPTTTPTRRRVPVDAGRPLAA